MDQASPSYTQSETDTREQKTESKSKPLTLDEVLPVVSKRSDNSIDAHSSSNYATSSPEDLGIGSGNTSCLSCLGPLACKAVIIQHANDSVVDMEDYQFPEASCADKGLSKNMMYMPDVKLDACPGPDPNCLFVDLEEVDVYRGKDSSPTDTSVKNVAYIIKSLPDLVVSSIFKFLYWKEKILAVKAFPSWERILTSQLGWQFFENDRGYAHSYEPLISNHYVVEEMACIAQYGKFFGNCIIWIHNFLPIDSPVDTDFTILKYIEQHCLR